MACPNVETSSVPLQPTTAPLSLIAAGAAIFGNAVVVPAAPPAPEVQTNALS